MKMFKTFFVTFLISILVIITGCNSTSDEKEKTKICPQCHMGLPHSSINTALIIEDGKKIYFDDIGCMVLWSKDNNIDLKDVTTKAFTHDTKRYVDAFKLHYRIDEKTPMHYGFGAYEKEVKNSIDFNEVILKMLRGENMANPKIRKQILGY